MDRKIKVLIVDDSVLFRSLIQKALSNIDSIEVVGMAANGKIALEKLCALDVDVLVLDLEMPVMDGMETVKAIKVKELQTKIIIFSSSNKLSAEKTLEAMNMGALDFVPKPISDNSLISPDEKIKEVLVPKIVSLFPREHKVSVTKKIRPVSGAETLPKALVIASSTGGPNALNEFFSHLKHPLPFPIFITQHMPPVFTASLAQRIGSICGKASMEGVHGELVKNDRIYLAPGDFHMSLAGKMGEVTIHLDQRPNRNFVRPCADFLFESASAIYGRHLLGIVFTGMGRDGADGAREIKANGGTIYIQDQASSVVFGMPGAVHESGNYDIVGGPTELAQRILTIINGQRGFYVA